MTNGGGVSVTMYDLYNEQNWADIWDKWADLFLHCRTLTINNMVTDICVLCQTLPTLSSMPLKGTGGGGESEGYVLYYLESDEKDEGPLNA